MPTFLSATGLVALAAVATVNAFAAPVQGKPAGNQRHNNYYYKSYDTAYRPACAVRKVRSYDYWGKLVVRKVRICQ